MLKKIKDLFKSSESAHIAKDRLHIIVSHNHTDQDPEKGDYLLKMEKDMIDVIAKYVDVDREQVKVHLDKFGDKDVLEINIELPEN